MPVTQQAKASRKAARQRFNKARIAEQAYTRALVGVGRQVGLMVDGFVRVPTPNIRQAASALEESLHRYGQLITPWAQRVTRRMQLDVSSRDMRSWKALANTLGRSLARELGQAPVGPALHGLMAEQVALIQSIPLEAAVRVHERTIAALVSGTRYEESLIGEIMRIGNVAESRARLIARTETSRTQSVLTQVRAEFAGSEAYIWRTALDEQVRPVHANLEGRIIKWNEPPLAGPGQYYHAGRGPNCRCYAEPILPE
jgi:SPP1 gp7 family putative phage head morphogenesis protein